MGSDSVTCHPAEMTFQPLPQPKLVFDLQFVLSCHSFSELLQLWPGSPKKNLAVIGAGYFTGRML